MKVYFVGSHATGKTELARFVSRAYKLPLISEVARAVLAEMETDLPSIRADLDRAAEYQRKVFQLQVAAEAGKDRFVSDRSFDNLAYAAINTCALAKIADPAVLRPYLDRVRTGIVFFCRPDPALLVADGVRAEISMESAMRVDAMVHLMLEQWSIPYVSVRGSDRQERRRLVEAVVGLAQDRDRFLEESKAMGELAAILSAAAIPTCDCFDSVMCSKHR